MADQTDEALTDLHRRRNTHGTDEQGRHQVNAHGDVDVVRTPKGQYPVALPLEPGAHVTIDEETWVFTGFRKDALKFVESLDYDPEPDGLDPRFESSASSIAEGVHSFNTRVRDATEVSVKYPED